MLPSGYLQLEYIESTGTQYIDTGIVPNSKTRLYAKLKYKNRPSGNSRSGWGSAGSQESFFFGANANNFVISVSTNWRDLTNLPVVDTNIHSFDIKSGEQKFDNVVYGNTTIGNTASLGQTIYLFKFHTEYSSNEYASIILYETKIYDDATLIRDLTPALRISDNVVGLYDLANDVFYTNAGSGTFLKGKVIAEENIIIEDNPLQTTLENDLSLVANFKIKYNITLDYDETLGNATWSWGQGNNVNLSASPFEFAQFKGWYIDDVLISRDLQTTYEVNEDTTFEARFTPKYSIELDYDSDVGSATFTRDSDEQNLINLSVVSTITKFNGWYINDTLISYDNNAQYLITEDSVIEARFEPIWEINDSVVGDGAIQYTRQSSNRNIVSFSVIPDDNRHFVKYVVNDVEYTETPLTLTLTEDLTIVAYFEEDDKFHISVSTNIDNGSVYVSHNDDYATYQSTLWVRPFPNYVFEKWSDGNRENPRTISVDKNITLIAEYTHIQETNGIYQYRCYVKDQLDLEAPPKAFMVVDTFDIKEDYLTKANSTINVLKMNTNINNGDVIVVYNPKGETIYQGVITSISDNKITTSQMQSFYKGLWIYNVKPQTYLEDELKLLLQDYANGKLYKSTYTDTLVAQRLGGITIQSVGATQVNLPTDLDKDNKEQLTQYDMEQFIYKLYQDYGIIFDFTINFSGTNYVNIKVPTYSPLSIGNNHYAIQNLTPIQKVEETNRLVIYSSQKVYRTTYVATTNGIVEQPSSLVNRFNITNTKVVFSDDSVDTLIASNLPTSMYNHKLNFDLFLKNSLYEYEDFKLGMPLEIYYNGTDYYNSVLTGRNMKKASNQNVNVVSYVCGLVRSSITTKLTLKDVL